MEKLVLGLTPICVVKEEIKTEPTDDKPTDNKPTNDKNAADKHTENKPNDDEPSEDKPTNRKSIDDTSKSPCSRTKRKSSTPDTLFACTEVLKRPKLQTEPSKAKPNSSPDNNAPPSKPPGLQEDPVSIDEFFPSISDQETCEEKTLKDTPSLDTTKESTTLEDPPMPVYTDKEIKKKLKCLKCNYLYVNEEELKQHLGNLHENSFPAVKLRQSGEKHFECEHCSSYKTKVLREMGVHLFKKHDLITSTLIQCQDSWDKKLLSVELFCEVLIEVPEPEILIPIDLMSEGHMEVDRTDYSIAEVEPCVDEQGIAVGDLDLAIAEQDMILGEQQPDYREQDVVQEPYNVKEEPETVEPEAEKASELSDGEVLSDFEDNACFVCDRTFENFMDVNLHVFMVHVVNIQTLWKLMIADSYGALSCLNCPHREKDGIAMKVHVFNEHNRILKRNFDKTMKRPWKMEFRRISTTLLEKFKKENEPEAGNASSEPPDLRLGEKSSTKINEPRQETTSISKPNEGTLEKISISNSKESMQGKTSMKKLEDSEKERIDINKSLPHACQICRTKFATILELVSHVFTHSPELGGRMAKDLCPEELKDGEVPNYRSYETKFVDRWKIFYCPEDQCKYATLEEKIIEEHIKVVVHTSMKFQNFIN